REMFKASRPRFGKPAWLGLFFLLGPTVAPFFSMFLPRIGELNLSIILVSVIFAVTNGTLEEVLWRGTYVTVFPENWLWSTWYPSIWFGYWHLSPQVVFPSQMPGGAFAFATMSIFLGLVFGWVAKQTGSIRWTTTAHILTDFMGLAGLAFVGGGY
ncbi:MAG: CPBP family intramembrane glutamic endopeptidase, partial [Anaerolineae bacterium]